jgi:hypothetical protein
MMSDRDFTAIVGEEDLESDMSRSEDGVCGNESELAECGRSIGRLGMENGI